MTPQVSVQVILGFVSVVAVPWVVFVTASIFGLRQQVALLKQEIEVLDRIHDVLKGLVKA